MSHDPLERMSRRELRQRIKRADVTLFKPALQYLEADPKSFGCGYSKEVIWKYIKRYDLQPEHITRLEHVSMQYLRRPMSREYKHMCQTMSRIATDDFWQKIESQLESDNPRVQVNAYCLHAYADGIMAGERRRAEFKAIKWRLGYWVHKYRYYTVPELLEIIHEPENWVDGVVVKHNLAGKVQLMPDNHEFNEDFERSDYSVMPDNSEFDEDFERLDYNAMKSEVILPKLKNVLLTGTLNIYNEKRFFYTLHVLGQLKDSNAVPIIIEFLQTKIDYKFEGPTRSLIEWKALAALRRLDTPEARQAIAQRT